MTSAAAIALWTSLAVARAPAAEAQQAVVGTVESYVVRSDESLLEIARGYDLGYEEIASANPGVDPWLPDEGTAVVIPRRFVLPAAVARGTITVNLSEMRLYFLPRTGQVVTFPIGTADDDYVTPLGTWRVVAKEVAPAWHVPPSARADHPELPAVVPPGPENPLGSHALRLSAPGILIHGTNKPFGVGRRVSRGCIRLYPEDIPKLFQVVPVGTRVQIVREPAKVGVVDGRVYVEVHADDTVPIGADDVLRLVERRRLRERIDEARVRVAVAEKLGIPVDVTKR